MKKVKSKIRFYSLTSLFVLTLLIVFGQFGLFQAMPQSSPWEANKIPKESENENDPWGNIGKPPTNTNPWDDTPFFKDNKPSGFDDDFFANNDHSSRNNDDWETLDKRHKRTRDAALSMFWIIAFIIIATFVLFGAALIACICIPTCYLAQHRNRTEGRVYQQAAAGPGVLMTTYPTQAATPYPPPNYQGQSQFTGQYPYSGPPNSAYPTTGLNPLIQNTSVAGNVNNRAATSVGF